MIAYFWALLHSSNLKKKILKKVVKGKMEGRRVVEVMCGEYRERCVGARYILRGLYRGLDVGELREVEGSKVESVWGYVDLGIRLKGWGLERRGEERSMIIGLRVIGVLGISMVMWWKWWWGEREKFACNIRNYADIGKLKLLKSKKFLSWKCVARIYS